MTSSFPSRTAPFKSLSLWEVIMTQKHPNACFSVWCRNHVGQRNLGLSSFLFLRMTICILVTHIMDQASRKSEGITTAQWPGNNTCFKGQAMTFVCICLTFNSAKRRDELGLNTTVNSFIFKKNISRTYIYSSTVVKYSCEVLIL